MHFPGQKADSDFFISYYQSVANLVINSHSMQVLNFVTIFVSFSAISAALRVCSAVVAITLNICYI
jgi:hypothetical protein